MKTTDDLAVAACHSVDPDRWRQGLDELMGRIAGRFPQVEPRRRARAFLEGLLAGLSRVNCWSIAEQVGDASPDGMQHLLARASWDHDGVAGDLREYVVEHLGADDGMLVVDETGTSRRAPRTCPGRGPTTTVAKYALSGPNLAHNERNRAGPRLAWIVLERDPDHRRCFRSGSLAASDPEGSDTLNPDQHTGWAPTMLRSDQSVNDR